MLGGGLQPDHEETRVLFPHDCTPAPTASQGSSEALVVCCRSRFFSSDGLLKEVSEVNRMNDSLQVELQVRGGAVCFKSPLPVCIT